MNVLIYVFIFSTTLPVTQTVTSNPWVIGNTGLYGMQKGAVTAQFKVLSRYFPGGAEDNHEDPQVSSGI
jgi:hypothetical protein